MAEPISAMSVWTATSAAVPAEVRPGIFASAASSLLSSDCALCANEYSCAAVTGEPNSFFALAIQNEQTWFAWFAHEPCVAGPAPAPDAAVRAAATAAVATRSFVSLKFGYRRGF